MIQNPVTLPVGVVPQKFAVGRLRLLRTSLIAGEWWLSAQILEEAYSHQDWGPLGLGGPLSYYTAAGISRSRASVLMTCARAGVLEPSLSVRQAYQLARAAMAANPTPL